MTPVSVELKTLVSEPDALTTRPPPFAKRSICIIDNGASRRHPTRNSRFRARRADHSTTSICKKKYMHHR